MSVSLNKVMIIGRLGKDPELKYTQTGVPLCNLSVATDESYTDRDGQKVNKVEWHKVQVWNRSAENCNAYLAKGSLVFVEGSITTRKWQDQQGQDRYSTEIKAMSVQFLDRRGEGGSQGGGQGGSQGGNQNGSQNRQQQQRPPRDSFPQDFPQEHPDIDQLPF